MNETSLIASCVCVLRQFCEASQCLAAVEVEGVEEVAPAAAAALLLEVRLNSVVMLKSFEPIGYPDALSSLGVGVAEHAEAVFVAAHVAHVFHLGKLTSVGSHLSYLI